MTARTERLTIRLTPEEKDRVQEMARRDRRKDSDWARIILLEACASDPAKNRRGTTPADQVTDLVVEEDLEDGESRDERKYRRIPAAERLAIGREYLEGDLSLKEVSEKYGISRQTVANYAKDVSSADVSGQVDIQPADSDSEVELAFDPDLDLPCNCGHAKGAHRGPEETDGPQCTICPKDDEEDWRHPHTPDGSRTETTRPATQNPQQSGHAAS